MTIAAITASAPALPGGIRRRRKLWEIEPKWHCTIIGTCLTLGELRKVAAKAQVRSAETLSDYELHGAFVGAAGGSNLVSKLVHKLLERKYAGQVSRFAGAQTAGEVARLWDRSRKEGDIPGAVWALASHSLPCSELRDRAYGEVHMLSHLSGASNRADLRRLADLERQVAALGHDLAEARRRHAGDAARIAELQRALAAEAAASRRCELLEARLAELESDTVVSDLKARLAQAGAAQDKAGSRIAALERRLAERDTVIEALTDEMLQLTGALKAACGRQCDAAGPAAPSQPEPDLSGRCILYVGGAHSMVPHLQAAVARCNGELLYHDGGIEGSCARLTSALTRADAILCPVTCVSHDAVDHIKRACRRCAKPFVPLRSTGLSAFLHGLQAIGGTDSPNGPGA